MQPTELDNFVKSKSQFFSGRQIFIETFESQIEMVLNVINHTSVEKLLQICSGWELSLIITHVLRSHTHAQFIWYSS